MRQKNIEAIDQIFSIVRFLDHKQRFITCNAFFYTFPEDLIIVRNSYVYFRHITRVVREL